MNDIRAIVIRGDFTDAEFNEVVALLREMDKRRPEARIEVAAVAPETAMETGEQLAREALPPMPGRHTEFFLQRTATDQASGRGDSEG